jgi:exodeoxyribonuclease VII large subunit
VGISPRLQALNQRLHLAHPQRRVDQTRGRLDLLKQRLGQVASRVSGQEALPRLAEAGRRLLPALAKGLEARHHRLEVLGARLQTQDPKGPLDRGFVLVRDGQGRPLTRSADAPGLARVALQWKDGIRKADLLD